MFWRMFFTANRGVSIAHSQITFPEVEICSAGIRFEPNRLLNDSSASFSLPSPGMPARFSRAGVAGLKIASCLKISIASGYFFEAQYPAPSLSYASHSQASAMACLYA